VSGLRTAAEVTVGRRPRCLTTLERQRWDLGPTAPAPHHAPEWWCGAGPGTRPAGAPRAP